VGSGQVQENDRARIRSFDRLDGLASAFGDALLSQETLGMLS